jgi:hypothetical protein
MMVGPRATCIGGWSRHVVDGVGAAETILALLGWLASDDPSRN